jgi:predicted TIM-barrel fold metal-dependent hydrolase
MERLIVVSGDGHAGTEPDGYREYLDPQYRDALEQLAEEQVRFQKLGGANNHDHLPPDVLEVIDDAGAIRAAGDREGSWDATRRLAEMDREGVAAEVMLAGTQRAIQPFFSVVNQPHPPELRAAGARAYHRWAADLMGETGGRIVGVAEAGPCIDLDETIAELRWCRDHGFVAVSPPLNTGDASLPPLTDPYYEPFWAACDDLGLVLTVHAGWGHVQGRFWEFAAQFEALVVGKEGHAEGSHEAMMEALNSAEDSPLALDMGPRRVMWQLMLGGVFDRHPGIRLALTEVRADWIPPTLAALDARFAAGDTTLNMTPSEYWRQHCYATPSAVHHSEMEMRHEIGVDRMLFGVDFPHPESTWPNTRDWIRATFSDVPEDEARLILGENAIRCYGLDRALLAGVAERIGPEPRDVLGAFDVDARRLEHFDQRAGLNRPAETVDPEAVTSLFDEDVRALVR